MIRKTRILSIVAGLALFVAPGLTFAATILSQTDATTPRNGDQPNAGILIGSTAAPATSATAFGGTLTGIQFAVGDNRSGAQGVPAVGNLEIVGYPNTGCFGLPAFDQTGIYLGNLPASPEILSLDLSTYALDLSSVECVEWTITDNYFLNATFEATLGSSGGVPYVVMTTDGTPLPAAPTVTTTQITAVQPASGSTIATSSAATFGVTGFVAASDYTAGMVVTMQYAPYVASQEASAIPQSFYTTLTFPVTSSGAFSFSTTSPATTAGEYTMQTSITGSASVNFFGLFNFTLPFSTTGYTSTSTTFVASQLNGYDIFMASSTALINNYLASSTISLASCTSFTSFNLGDCINLLFVPQAGPMGDLYTSFKQNFLSYYPWGYVTRLGTLLVSPATSSLPDIEIAINTPYSQGIGENDTTTLRFDENEMLANAANDLNSVDANGTSCNWQCVLEPYLDLFLAATILLIIIHDLLGLYHRRR